MAVMRSPNYPAVGLGVAIDLAKLLWEREKRSYVPISVAVKAWGYTGLSGNARTKIAALKKYELIEENDSGDVRLSDIAVNILHNPVDSPERNQALQSAASKPELFRDLQNTYPDASDETIRSYLITKKEFSETGAEAAIESFRDTRSVVKLEAMVDKATATESEPKSTALFESVGTMTQGDNSSRSAPPASSQFFSWPLSKGVLAEVRFTGNVQPKHLSLLCKYLEVAKTAMQSDSDDEDEAIQ